MTICELFARIELFKLNTVINDARAAISSSYMVIPSKKENVQEIENIDRLDAFTPTLSSLIS